MLNARIGGDLGGDGAVLEATGRGKLSLSAGFQSTGAVHLPGCQIYGDFDCAGAELKDKTYLSTSQRQTFAVTIISDTVSRLRGRYCSTALVSATLIFAVIQQSVHTAITRTLTGQLRREALVIRERPTRGEFASVRIQPYLNLRLSMIDLPSAKHRPLVHTPDC